MAFIMLLSTTGFSIDLHFCQGQIKSLSFIGEAKSCHSQTTKPCSSKKKACSIKTTEKDCQKDCCSNKTIIVDASDADQKIPNTELSSDQMDFLTAFVEVYILSHYDFYKNIIPYQNYVPPLLDRDISVLVQCFLL